MRLRTFAAAGTLLLAALGAYADNPSDRAEARLAFDPTSNHIILYGGATPVDTATKIIYDQDDTWQFDGKRWVRLYTAHSPGARSGHVMVLDTNRNRIVVFGGRRTDTSKPNGVQSVLNDTWAFQNNDWTQIDTPNAPPGRTIAGADYDSVRDRIVLYGGNTVSTDGKNTITALRDTWEFDGTTWTQRGSDGPNVTKPIVFYDQANHATFLVGLDPKSSTQTGTLMFRYDADAGTWTAITPTGLPPCVNEAQVAFDATRGHIILTGGACTDSDPTDTTYEWDGTQWTKLDVKTAQDRIFGGAFAYDPVRQQDVLYGGTIAFGNITSVTSVFKDGDWSTVSDSTAPGPRSLASFWYDPHLNQIMLFGGMETNQTFGDLWSYTNGTWTQYTDFTHQPTNCLEHVAAYDTDRQKLVLVCAGGDVWEFDGTAWKDTKASDLKTHPGSHRLSSIAYDQSLKKTVYFGGFDETNFLQETWLWDGTSWSRIKNHLPPYRAQAAMWYDQNLKKTVIYGGVGRTDPEGRIERFDDMWALDANGWTKLTPATTPGQRYSATYAVDPRDGHVLLFSGILYNKDPKTAVETQRYVNDMWEWDGTNWKQLQTGTNPPPRENAGFVYDPNLDRFVMFGGFAALFYGDVWLFDRNSLSWQVRLEAPTSGIGRRRAR
jgi:Galactose oxidase, central domain